MEQCRYRRELGYTDCCAVLKQFKPAIDDVLNNIGRDRHFQIQGTVSNARVIRSTYSQTHMKVLNAELIISIYFQAHMSFKRQEELLFSQDCENATVQWIDMFYRNIPVNGAVLIPIQHVPGHFKLLLRGVGGEGNWIIL